MEPVASPCIKACQLDPAGQWCMGCGRTLAEIAGWNDEHEAARRAIAARAAQRLEDEGENLSGR